MQNEETKLPATKGELIEYLNDLIIKSREGVETLEAIRDAADLTEGSPVHATIARLKELIPRLEQIQEKLLSTLWVK